MSDESDIDCARNGAVMARLTTVDDNCGPSRHSETHPRTGAQRRTDFQAVITMLEKAMQVKAMQEKARVKARNMDRAQKIAQLDMALAFS